MYVFIVTVLVLLIVVALAMLILTVYSKFDKSIPKKQKRPAAKPSAQYKKTADANDDTIGWD